MKKISVMIKRESLVIYVALIILCVVIIGSPFNNASASQSTFNFEGTGGLLGFYTFESSTPNTSGSSTLGTYIDVLTDLQFSVQGFTGLLGDYSRISIANDNDGSDSYSLYADNVIFSDTVGNNYLAEFSFVLERENFSQPPDMLDSTDLPLSPPLQPWDGESSGWNISYSTEFLYGQMTSLTVAPEPISSTLFIVGGATLGFRRLRIKFKK